MSPIKRIIKRIFFAVLLLLILGVAIFCITQRDNIQAVILGLNHEQTEIEQMQTDSKTSLANKFQVDLQAIEEMAEQIAPEGEPSESEEVTSSPDTPQTSKPEVPPAKEPASSSATSAAKPSNKETGISHSSKEIELLLARFYAMQSSYVGKLETIKSNAYAEYKALPKDERGTNAKIRIGKQAASNAAALEAECDAKINALLKELRSALSKNGLDQSLANEVRRHYATEKSLLKAQYMNKYKKYLS